MLDFHGVRTFFFNDTATTEIYTLSLHDALPIYQVSARGKCRTAHARPALLHLSHRSEEHTSELQSPCNLVCRLLLETARPNPLDRDALGSCRALVCGAANCGHL